MVFSSRQLLKASLSFWAQLNYWRKCYMCCQQVQDKKHVTNSILHRLATFILLNLLVLTFFQLKPWKRNLRDQEKDKGQAPGRESKLLKPEILQGLHPANWLPSSSKIGLGEKYQFSMPRSLLTRLLQICNLLNATYQTCSSWLGWEQQESFPTTCTEML